MSAEHAELVMEMQALEKLPHSERVKHAKKRRGQQLRAYQQYDKKADSKAVRKSRMDRSKSNRGLQFAQSTLLFDAAIRNDLEEAEALLQSGVDPNLVGGDSLSVLHQCCLNDLPDMMKLFIRYGADVDSKDCDNWTPLHLSATCGNISLCQCLCDNNADLLALNTDGNMPYDLCDDLTTLDFIESEMAKRGITQELIDETRLMSENEMLKDLEKFASKGGDLNLKGTNGETMLHIAACMGYGRVIDFLLKRKIPVNSVDNEGWQAHHMATYYGQYHVLESLLLGGADPNARTQAEDTMIDLCDFEAQPKVHALILDIQNRGKQMLSTPSTLDRNNSTRRGSQATLHPGRRSSIHDKATMAHREAIMEGQRLQGSIVRTEEEDDDDTESDFIEIPAITINSKTPDTRVEKPRTHPKSILKKSVAKTISTTPKNDFKDTDIWNESSSPTGVKKSDVKINSSERQSALSGSSPNKNSVSSKVINPKFPPNQPSSPVSPKTNSTLKNSSKQPNGSQADLPGTLSDLKSHRKMKRDIKQPNGATKNNSEGTKKHKTFSNKEEMVSDEQDKNKCCIVS